MDFNFGQSTDFGSKGGSELIVGQGESAIFAPGELDMDVDFSKGQGNDSPAIPLKPEDAPVPQAKPKPGTKAKPEISLDPDESKLPEPALKSSIDLELDDDIDPDSKEDEGDEPLGDQTQEGDDDPDYNPYEEYAQEMFKAGIFTPLEGDEDIDFSDENVLKQRFEKEKIVGAQKTLDNFLGKFGPKQIEAFNAIFVQGNNPETYYKKITKIENLEKVDLADMNTQEKLVKSYLGRLGWSDDEISEKIEKVKEYNDLEREAKVAHKHLLKAEQDELAADAIENQKRITREQQINNMYVSGVHQNLNEAITKKELGGIPVNKDTAARVYDMMATKKWNVEGKTMTTFEKMLEDLKDPRNVEIALKVALLYDSKFDFTPIKKKAVSEETNTLFTSIKRKNTTQRRGRTGTTSNDKWSI